MGLRDAEGAGDLSFGHVGVESEEDDPPLSGIERAEPALEQDAVLAFGDGVGLARLVGLGVSRRGERHWIPGPVGGHQSFDLAHVGVERGSDLGDLGRAPEGGHQGVARAAELAAHPLDAAGQPQSRRALPEMPADLTFDRGRDEGRERDSPARVEAGRGLDQADRSSLDEVVDLLAAPGVAARHRAHERQMRAHEFLALGIAKTRAVSPRLRRYHAPDMSFSTDVALAPCDRYHYESTRDSTGYRAFFGIESRFPTHIKGQNLIMADHLVTKFWGLCPVLIVALVTLALAPAGAEASGPGSSALSQLGSIVPAPAQAAVAAAVAQVPSPSPPAVSVASPPPATAPAPAPPPPAVSSTAAASVVDSAAAAVAARPVQQPASAIPTPTVSVPTVSVRTTGKRPNPPAPARSGSSLGGQASAHRVSRPKGHRTGQRGLLRPGPPSLLRRGPVAWGRAQWTLLPLVHAVTDRASGAAVAPARRLGTRKASHRARHVAEPPSRRTSAVTTLQPAPPVLAILPPGGAEGSAAGAGGGAAGATAAALLAIVGVCILRALLPGLLGLGLAPARSALLDLRLERPG